MPDGAEFFTRQCGDLSTLRLSALRLSKYSNTSIDFFLSIPIDEFYAWIDVMNGEVARENQEMEASMEDAK